MILSRRSTRARDWWTGIAAVRARTTTTVGALVIVATMACSKDSSSPPITATCDAGDATTPPLGTVNSPLTGTSVCVGGGSAGAEYVLIPFNSSTQPAKVSFQVEATGVTAPGSPVFSIVPGAGASMGPGRLGVGTPRVRNTDFDARLRALEASLAPLIPAARRRAALRSRSSAGSRAVIPANITVGQRLELNTNSDDPCANPIYSIGRVVAVTSRSIVVADTANPTGGFTDADYEAIAATFDNVVDPLITSNFGQPADIDGNGRILLFFTRSVNEMTPADNNGSYIGGFFFGRDLFPQVESDVAGACASSNFGELFYLLVPDPTGVVNGNKFSTVDVREIAVSIVAHEYQHLINASRRIYISTTATDFEETWLNEGLSHIAEELLFYAQAGLAPRQDLDVADIRASQVRRDAFNADMGANFGRYMEFLENPTANSPYARDDSLATRGATWAFLRFAADHQTTAQASIWFQLVNSGPVGFANLRGVFGSENVVPLFRDWATSAFTDNIAGVAARYQQPSWDFRDIYTALTDPPAYPLATLVLAEGTPRSVQLVGGGAAYLRFKVPAGGEGQVTWGTVPSATQMTLVRTR